MASSGKLNPADPETIAGQVLRRSVAPGAHVLVGVSGGVDSVVLLTVMSRLAKELQFSVRAIHVNHGLSPNAAEWARFCASLCADLNVPMLVEAVDVRPYRSLGLEAAARRVRYEAYARHADRIVVLGQHRDDQAETLILQLLRGAGVSGLAGMPERRAVPGTRLEILRPFLSLSRPDIEAYAMRHNLAWVEDESNRDIELPRNFIRHRLLPILEVRYPGVAQSLARAASHLADADDLLRQLGREDAERCASNGLICVDSLRQLGVRRTANLLRFLCWERDIPRPSTARLVEVARQIVEAGMDSNPRHVMPGWEFRRYGGKLVIEPLVADCEAIRAGWKHEWHGEDALFIAELGGVLRFSETIGMGLSAVKLRSAEVTIRLRQGGERYRPDAGRPRRTLKNLFQERKVPPWRRACLPLIFCGEALVSVPGIGDDCDWLAGREDPGIVVWWEPRQLIGARLLTTPSLQS